MSLPRVLFMLALLVTARCLSAQQSVTAIPMELRRNMPFVQVMVNGKGPFTFGIDTGTGGEALVTPDLIQQLGLAVTGETEVGDPSGHNPQKKRAVQINTLKLGEVEFKDVRAVEFQPSRQLGVTDGILGFILFREYLFSLDYPQQLVRLARGSIVPDGGNEVVSFSMPDNVPVIELGFGEKKLDAHLDSRGFGLSIPDKFAQDLKFASVPVVIGRGRTASSEFEIKGAQLASDVRLGGYTLTQPFVEINPILSVGNFGAFALRNFAVTFDQKNKLLRLVAKDKAIVIAPPHMGPAQPAVAK